MSNSLRQILTDARFPSGSPAHSGGMEAACHLGLVTDLDSLRSFLHGRLWTAGAIGAVAAAAVCARARGSHSATALIRSVEAEIDARTPSPAARRSSRDQGGHVLRLALAVTVDPLMDALGRAAVAHFQRPHHATAIGAVAAVAGATPRYAAESAAFASVTGPAFAAQSLLRIDPGQVSQLGTEMAHEVKRLAKEAAHLGLHSLAQMPAFAAPALEYLAEEHVAAHPKRSFAS